MYGYTSSQIKTKAIIALVLAVIFSIVSIIAGDPKFSSLQDILYLVLAPIVLAWGFLAWLINWKKMLLGFITPIPIVSYILEGFKAMIMAPIALIWALSHPNA